jgi:hypothetical protein
VTQTGRPKAVWTRTADAPWGMPEPVGVGIQPPAYEILAEQLEPWVERFVR